MKMLLPSLAAVSLLALTACDNKQPEVVSSVSEDPQAAELANRPKVELPPAIKADKTFRCKDNSLLYVTLFQGDKQAFVKTSPTGAINRLTAEKAGDPLTAEGGWKLTGTASNITITQPGKPSQTCKS